MTTEEYEAKIKKLEEELEAWKRIAFSGDRALKKTNEMLRTYADGEITKTPAYRHLLAQKESLEEQLKNLTKHNARGAGRKPDPMLRISKYPYFKKLYDDGYSVKEIMEKMDISRTTYYRYKKECIDSN